MPPPARGRARSRERLLGSAAEIPPQTSTLVHGDLHLGNVLWSEAGPGVLDWDVASAWDPAVDVACLVGSRIDLLQGLVDPEMLRRAEIWRGTFLPEQVAAAILRDERPAVVSALSERAASWLRSTDAERLDRAAGAA